MPAANPPPTSTTASPIGDSSPTATTGVSEEQKEEEETLDPAEKQSSRAEAELQDIMDLQTGQKKQDDTAKFLPIKKVNILAQEPMN